MDFATAQTPTLAQDTRYGAKTRRLSELFCAKLPVPNFVAFPQSALAGDVSIEGIAAIVRQELPVARYAVRSSALTEDADDRAHAGEFLTVLSVPSEELPTAIARVLDDARSKLGDLNAFSLLIQEYIDPEFAGVVFTRDPRGGVETIVEWTRGTGEAVVGGKTVERVVLVRGRARDAEPFGGFHELLRLAYEIEGREGRAEDIEWAIAAGRVVIVQARPITTLLQRDIELYQEIERTLPQHDAYLYARSASLEAFAYPTPLALSLLHALHAVGGPIDRVYRRFGIRRDVRETFKLFGAGLYVDREQELQEFFPSHSLLRDPLGSPRFARPGGIFRTLRNMTALAGIRADQHMLAEVVEAVGASLSRALAYTEGSIKFSDALNVTVRHYESVFLANLISEKAVSSLASLAEEEQVPLALLLSAPAVSAQVPEIAVPFPEGLVGNSIDPHDTTPFVAKPDPVFSGSDAWNQLSPETKKRLTDPVALARAFLSLRERARWLSVTLACVLRNALRTRAQELGIDAGLLVFASESVLRGDTVDIEALRALARSYDERRGLRYPKRIASEPAREGAHGGLGISHGTSEGVLVSLLSLSTVAPGTPIILVTETLSPDLVAYFPKLAGLVACEGGILSHAAVTAREFSLPVVVVPDIFERFHEGEVVRIDGASGAIERKS